MNDNGDSCKARWYDNFGLSKNSVEVWAEGGFSLSNGGQGGYVDRDEYSYDYYETSYNNYAETKIAAQSGSAGGYGGGSGGQGGAGELYLISYF